MSTFVVSVACNTSSFDQNMVLIFTRLRTKGTGQIPSFFPLGVFALDTHRVFRRQLRIVYEIIKCIQHLTS